jgi:hypothetical protein
MEDVSLPELLSDNLFNVPEDIFMVARVTEDSVRERKIVRPKQSYSERQTSSEESGNNNEPANVGATTRVK